MSKSDQPDSHKSAPALKRLAIGLVLLCVLALLLTPLFFRPRPAKAPQASRTPRARRLATVDSHRGGKVEISQPLLRLAKDLHVRASVTESAGADLAIAEGTRLVAVIDNACAEDRLLARKRGELGSTSLTLSEIALGRAEKGRVPSMTIQAYAFNAAMAASVADLEAEAQNDECLESLTDERERRIHFYSNNDPMANNQAHLGFLFATSAWNIFYKSGRPIVQDVVVAVVDTGVDNTHQDLTANMWHGPNGGFGYDFVNGNTTASDDVGHGTHVAGLVGAVANNGLGGLGVMGTHIKIMSVKVIDGSDTGTLSDLVNGIHFAVDNGASVVNLSLGGPDSAQAEADALAYATGAGAVVVIAAGNSALDLSAGSNDYPAGYATEVPGAVAVGSIDSQTGKLSYFSNYSPNYVYIAAPGADNSSSDLGLLSTYPSNQYQRLAGTSMSAPLVSGAAALLYGLAKTSGMSTTASQVLNTILWAARSDSALTGSFRNGAVLDLSRLSTAAQLRYMLDGDAGTGESP